MEYAQSKPFLKEERSKTDESLNAERDKTNESIAKSKAIAERQTDKKVQGEREDVDQAISESRQEADVDFNEARLGRGYGLQLEKKIGDERLSVERDLSDRAIETERVRVDLAFDKEREIMSTVANRLLEQERNRTDRNLSTERSKTDTEVKQAAVLLFDEISEHSKTKVSLTTRDEFLAIVSHDLKNPIGNASLCAEMLLSDPALNDLRGNVRQSIELIKRNVDASLRLIADLLDMERIEGGKLQLNIEKHDVGQIIQEVVEIFDRPALEKNIILRTMPSDILGQVFCDKDRIMQVLSNLIGNALKFTPAGGSIILSAELNETETQFSVRDSGPGIPEHKKQQIFERYAQLGVNNRVGLGLGLYISKMLIETHRGRLWVDSKVGEGSTFYFTIPR